MNVFAASRRLVSIVRARGPLAASRHVSLQLLSLVVHRKARCAEFCAERLTGKNGLEIGGPSNGFRRSGALPLYRYAARMDNCNFSAETVWEGAIDDSIPFTPEPESGAGTQYVREATGLSGIANQTYDFVCSSHALEHVANPLRALEEWKRVLRPGGILVLVLPHKHSAFDHRRPVTTLDHLVEDYRRGVGEDDLTHCDEILELHDLSLDLDAGDFEAFRERSLQNESNRCLHHHVFDEELVVRMAGYAGFETLSVELFHPYGIILIGAMPMASG